jgi:hypothetical protein
MQIPSIHADDKTGVIEPFEAGETLSVARMDELFEGIASFEFGEIITLEMMNELIDSKRSK